MLRRHFRNLGESHASPTQPRPKKFAKSQPKQPFTVSLTRASPKKDRGSTGGAFGLLNARLQEWLSENHWTLRPVQEKTVPGLLKALEANENQDFIISTPTASGKTEAVFLPIASLIDRWEAETPGAKVLYICPLKALIDQQAKRLSSGLLGGKKYP
jgi:ATP-dependent Lhr-like helicase